MANEDWAKDPNTRPEVLAMLSTSPSETVRLLVAQNPTTPDSALMHLAKDENDAVRKAIVQRSKVSSEVLRIASLPRDVLEKLDLPETHPEEEFELPDDPEYAGLQPEVAPTPQPEAAQATAPAPAVARKPSIFAWFWRLFGRSA